MDNHLIITWHGHSCFSVTYDQFTMVIDPYKDNTVPGLTPLSLFADEVYTTHEHGDHNYRNCARKPIASLPGFSRGMNGACVAKYIAA